METSYIFIFFASILSHCNFRVLAAPTVASNLPENVASLEKKVLEKGSTEAEQVGKSPRNTKTNMQLADDFDDEYLTSAMLEFGDMDRDGMLNYDEIFRFYLAVVRFPLKKASDTAQSFLDLGDINKDGKLSLKEMLKIMDEAQHLAEARKLMKTGTSKEGQTASNHSEDGKSKDLSQGTKEGRKKEKHKSSHSEEENVEELHNLKIAM